MDTTLNFMKKLKKNNNRDWFQAYRSDNDEAHQEMI